MLLCARAHACALLGASRLAGVAATVLSGHKSVVSEEHDVTDLSVIPLARVRRSVLVTTVEYNSICR